jgi:hypothetical protein
MLSAILATFVVGTGTVCTIENSMNTASKKQTLNDKFLSIAHGDKKVARIYSSLYYSGSLT